MTSLPTLPGWALVPAGRTELAADAPLARPAEATMITRDTAGIVVRRVVLSNGSRNRIIAHLSADDVSAPRGFAARPQSGSNYLRGWHRPDVALKMEVRCGDGVL